MNRFSYGYDLTDGERIIFNNGLTNAAKELNMSISAISMVLHGKNKYSKGWTFEYLDEGEYYD